ncbi:Flp family type IVb pilin [Asticcacaulis sp. EMRT-3]|uniref:Flp family type IVb pilin n=1 Tax=Asticcacaulis sp. EMRT-3 TaxID=3040349 RepID=UPI0024AF6237|nr:Flp family type IVb pilin [Asticcacaulis sp. EMRT-3]MDI7776023.1 Flp family type IVb pilin [Asticcacaulis sp. EMRT-3]
MFRRFFNDTSGATAIEYGLIAAIIFLGCIGAFYAFGTSAINMFSHVSDSVLAVANRAN